MMYKVKDMSGTMRISQHRPAKKKLKLKTFRIEETLDRDLKRAGDDRYGKGRWPYTDSGILTLALEEWLEREGYVKGVEEQLVEEGYGKVGEPRGGKEWKPKEPPLKRDSAVEEIMQEEARPEEEVQWSPVVREDQIW